MWNHTMAYGTGWGMWLLMALGAFGFWALVVYLLQSVLKTRPTGSSARIAPRNDVLDVLDVLDVRLARGEIDSAEYERTRRLLTARP